MDVMVCARSTCHVTSKKSGRTFHALREECTYITSYRRSSIISPGVMCKDPNLDFLHRRPLYSAFRPRSPKDLGDTFSTTFVVAFGDVIGAVEGNIEITFSPRTAHNTSLEGTIGSVSCLGTDTSYLTRG